MSMYIYLCINIYIHIYIYTYTYDSGRLRAASDLEEIGWIDKSQKGVIKDLIIRYLSLDICIYDRHMYIWLYVYVCICTFMYVDIYMYTCIYAYENKSIKVRKKWLKTLLLGKYINVHMYTFVHTCIYIYMCINIHIYVTIYIDIYMYIYKRQKGVIKELIIRYIYVCL
jgi:hypothetical protein